MSKIAHIVYSGVGGLAEVALTLLDTAKKADSDLGRHCVAFFGVHPLADRYSSRCEQLEVDYCYIENHRGMGFSSLYRMCRWLRKERPDVVITHMPQMAFAFLFYWITNPKARLVVVEHHSNALKGRKKWMITLVSHWFSSASVYLTEEYRNQVKRKLKFLLHDKSVYVIPNGLDTGLYCPSNNRKVKSHNLVIGSQGRMTKTKDYITLLHAFAQIRRPGIRLEIAGDGEMRIELESLAQKLGIASDVDFLGMIPQDEMIELMRGWDIFVLSTLGETQSRAVMEAQSLGLPLIASDVSGVTAAVKNNENGLLVPAQDVGALAFAIETLVSSSGLRRHLSETARKYAVENFSVKESWSGYQKIISKVMVDDNVKLYQKMDI